MDITMIHNVGTVPGLDVPIPWGGPFVRHGRDRHKLGFLAVGGDGQQGREFPGSIGTVDIYGQTHPVAHGGINVLIDFHLKP